MRRVTTPSRSSPRRMLVRKPFARYANVRENTKAIALGDSKWIGVRKILSEGVYADPILGNVIEHVTAETVVDNIGLMEEGITTSGFRC
jgi:hypothetical protein